MGGPSADGRRFRALEAALARRGEDLALFLVYERPSQVKDRPALAKTYFAQRCVSDDYLNRMVEAFRSIGAYVEIFDGELPFLEAMANGRLLKLDRSLKVVYNGIGFGITPGGFQPGRMALIPAVADSYGLICANSDAYTCALALHRFHSFVLLRALGVAAPAVWHFRAERGWMGAPPPAGTKVIVKSTYEAWSVGVTQDSIFVVDRYCDDKVAAIAESIGQAVTVQEFVAGREVCVPILAAPDPLALLPVEQILGKAPQDPEAVMTIDDNLRAGAVQYVPFDGPPTLVSEMCGTALQVFDILQSQVLGRMDFRIDASGRPWLTDAAVTPGLSAGSSAFASVSQYGIDHPSFLRLVVAASLECQGVL